MGRENILIKCEENIETVCGLTNNSSINPIIKIMIEPIKERIDRINEICQVDKYTLTFIGPIGVGKSTAISNLIGLIDESILKTYQQSEHTLQDIPLLKTAEGRTTLCETVITLSDSDSCSVKIDALPLQEFELLIEQFCLYIDKQSCNDEKSECPIEIRRVITNMAKIPNNISDSQVMTNYINQTFDQNAEKTYTLKDAIIKNINYSERKVLSVAFNFNNEQGDISTWLKKTMSEINNGENDLMPFPKKIDINISKASISQELPEYIVAIQDTRGMDQIAVRDDILDCCYDLSKICIICDSITSYGNIISNTFLKNHYILQNSDLKHRCILLGLEKGAQLKKANGASGRETGKDIKKREALDLWNNTLCLENENLSFYNSFLGISYDQDENINGFDKQKYELEKSNVFNNIKQLNTNMYEAYNYELKEIYEQLITFSKNEVNDEQKKKLCELKAIVVSCKKDLTIVYDKCLKSLESEVRKQVNASCLRASVSRNGEYYNYNIYSNIANFCFSEFDNSCQKHLYYIVKTVSELLDNSIEIEKALKIALKLQIENLYRKFRDKDSQDFKNIMKQNLQMDPVWKEMSTYWGDGKSTKKYRDRIADELFEKIKNKNISQAIYSQKNALIFFDELSNFLTI